jgi:hypothetical protein
VVFGSPWLIAFLVRAGFPVWLSGVHGIGVPLSKAALLPEESYREYRKEQEGLESGCFY